MALCAVRHGYTVLRWYDVKRLWTTLPGHRQRQQKILVVVVHYGYVLYIEATVTNQHRLPVVDYRSSRCIRSPLFVMGLKLLHGILVQ